MDSEVATEIQKTELSNSSENVSSTTDEANKNELGTEVQKETQDTVKNDPPSIEKQANFEDEKENGERTKNKEISTEKEDEEKHIKTNSDPATVVVVNKGKSVESSEENTTVTVPSKEVEDSCEDSPENEKSEKNENTDSSVRVIADATDSPVISKDEQIEPKYATTEKNPGDGSGEEDERNEEDEEVSEEESSEDEVKVEEADKKTEKVEDVNVSEHQPDDSPNSVKNEVVIEEVKNFKTNDISNQIENIISDIDINIKAQEKIAQLKEQELQLIEKQKQLATQIHQQQLLAQKLIAQNQINEIELKRAQEIQQQQLHYQNINQYREQSMPKISEQYTNNYKQTQDDGYKTKEPSNVSRTVDLQKIFTPATDAPQILPKNRKLYASSAFYSPTLHPTVEDQVELARRISHSLSDISNQKSKGQSMFVNRKKRSVKWVHEGSFQGEDDIEIENQSLLKENTEVSVSKELTQLDKLPLKLIMNPRGQMRDYNSLKDSINTEAGLLSPENCAELITALQLHKGRGAELFAKRRRKADNWVVDETNAGTHSPSGIPDYQQFQAKPPSSPSILPAYSDAGKHRVQLNLHQDQLIEKYSKPGVTVVKSPWEAALQTGSASSAFLQDPTFSSRQTPISSVGSPVHFNQDVNDYPEPIHAHSRPITSYDNIINKIPQESNKNINDGRFYNQPISPCNPQRELAYKPTVAQGWGGRNVELPRGLYVPKEILLTSYAPPPVQTRNEEPVPNYQQESLVANYGNRNLTGIGNTVKGFPVATTTSGLYSSQPPKQQLHGPQSYVKVQNNSVETSPHVNFNPSPLPYEKLSKFQEATDQRSSNQSYLTVSKQHGYNNVRNVTPTPFGTELETRNYYSQPLLNKNKGVLNTPPTSFPSQSFNNCARGWSMGSGAERNSIFRSKAQEASINRLPYTDF